MRSCPDTHEQDSCLLLTLSMGMTIQNDDSSEPAFQTFIVCPSLPHLVPICLVWVFCPLGPCSPRLATSPIGVVILLEVKVAQSCPTLCDPMGCCPPDSSVHGDSPGKNTGVDSCSLLQGIFPIQDRTQVSCIPGGFFAS